MDGKVVHQLAHVFRLRFGPSEVGTIEFDDLISHLSNCADGALRIFLQRVAYGIEFESDRNGFDEARPEAIPEKPKAEPLTWQETTAGKN